jgi:hypothetical protein
MHKDRLTLVGAHRNTYWHSKMLKMHITLMYATQIDQTHELQLTIDNSQTITQSLQNVEIHYFRTPLCVCYHCVFRSHMPTVNILVILEGNAGYSRKGGMIA